MVDYIILGVLVLLIILVIYLLFKVRDNDKDSLDLMERLSRFEMNINKEINDSFNTMNDKMDKKLDSMNEKVHERIDQNFEKTNKTFMSVLERLSKIDEAQKKIDSLSTNIVSLESILSDKKTRGIFGEVNLNNILSNVFGEKNDKLYHIQYKMPNDTIADSVVFAPAPLGMIAIDSKFPLENYRLMVDKNSSDSVRSIATKQFKMDVKKHIDDISSKYIINGVTSDQAMMFVPAEAIFAEINAYHEDIVSYSQKTRVWLVSPTTLISTLTMIMMVVQNIERDKYTSVIHEELNKLGVEFSRFKERFDKLSKSIQTVNKDVEQFQITTDKIKKKFDSISNVEIQNNNLLEEEIEDIE